jgi:hypothetical protein
MSIISMQEGGLRLVEAGVVYRQNSGLKGHGYRSNWRKPWPESDDS